MDTVDIVLLGVPGLVGEAPALPRGAEQRDIAHLNKRYD